MHKVVSRCSLAVNPSEVVSALGLSFLVSLFYFVTAHDIYGLGEHILRAIKVLNLSFSLYFCQDIGILHSVVWLCTKQFVEAKAARGKPRPFPTLAVSDQNPFFRKWSLFDFRCIMRTMNLQKV